MRICLLSILAVAASLLASCDRKAEQTDQHQPGPNQLAKAGPGHEKDRLDYTHKGEAAPAVSFATLDGAGANLSQFKGKPLLLNLWATWCVPCIKELPTLDALAARDKGLNVVAVSQDQDGIKAVKPFWASHGYAVLKPYIDQPGKLGTALKGVGLPLTVLYDSTGHEVWRASGGMDYSSAEVGQLLSQAK